MDPNETEYLVFCERVRRTCNRIAAHCLGGRTEEAGKLALSLSTEAATRKAQTEMHQEAAAPERYDLSDLREHYDGDGGGRG
jgi:hypothetical protein